MERERLEQLGSEALVYVELERWKAERKKLQQQAPPVGVELDQWREWKEIELEEELKRLAENVVNVAATKLKEAGVFNPETLQAKVLEVLNVNYLLKPVIVREYLSYLQQEMERAISAYQNQNFENRFIEIDRQINEWARKLPEPFSPALINVDKRFPVERIAFLSSGHADKWLSEALKTKPVLFEPWERYTERLVQFYHEVYIPQAQKIRIEEEEAKRRAAETSVAEEPAPPPEPPPREDRSWIMRQMNEELEERYGSKRR